MTLIVLLDYIRRAQQAQQGHMQKHDTQLALIPFVESHPPTVDPEAQWATEDEIRERMDREDASWWERWWNND